MKAKLCASAAFVLALAMGAGACTAFADVNSKYFVDVNENSYGWSADAVDYLLTHNVASGVGDNKFAPDSQIKRCDFVVLLDKAFKLTPFSDYVANFNDINKDDYYYTAVVNAKGAGIIKNDYAFYPQVPITRGDAMQMLYTALDNAGYITNASTDLSMYSDADDVRDVNSQLALGTLTQMGIISGSDGRILFTSTMSRAEMAVVLYKALTYMEENEPAAAVKSTGTKTTVKKTVKPDTKETETKEETAKKDENVLEGKELKTTVVIDGEEITGISGSKVRMDLSSEDTVVVSKGVSTQIKDSLVQASGVKSTGVRLQANSSADISSSQITANNDNTYGVNGSDSTKVVIKNGQFIVEGKKAAGVYTAGRADIKDSTFNVKKGSAVIAENNGQITIENAKIEAKDVSNGLFYGLTGTGQDRGSTRITVKNSEITGDKKTTLFYANNSDLKATLENCKIEKVAKLVDSGVSVGAKGSGSSLVEIDLINQELTADVTCENISGVIINLKKGSHLTAAVNSQDMADYIEINVEDGSTLELVENSYIHSLNYDSIYDIYDNGRVIYYDSDNSGNNKLNGSDYPLQNGGFMTPMNK